jgi:hypothetical protein
MEHSPISWIGRINNVEVAILPRAIYRFTVVLCRNRKKKIPKFLGKHKRCQIVQGKRELNVGGNLLPDFRLYYRAIKTKSVW